MLNNSVPPRATLEVGGQKQLAGLGSYCWINSCADGPAISTSSVPLLVQSSLLAHLRLPLLEPPDELYLSTMWVSPPGQPLYDEFHKDEERATWYFNKPVVELGELPLRREQDIKLSLKPGFNVLIIIAVWEDYGDASYGFFIDMWE